MKSLAAIFFDLDQTLINYDDTSYAKTVETVCTIVALEDPSVEPQQLKAHYLEINRARWQATEMSPPSSLRDSGKEIWLDSWVKALARCGCTNPEVADSALALYVEKLHGDYKLFDDALPVLTQLRKRLPLAVITNGPSDIQWDKLRVLGLESYFDVCVVSGDVGVAKPDATIFQVALEKLGVSADAAWHIGDNLHVDVEGAMAAGLRGIWLNRRGLLGEPESRPDLEVRSLTELLQEIAGQD